MNYYNYFTEIEEHFARRRGKHLYVSPLDWSLISVWRASGVPLHVALRGIDIAMDTWHSKPRRGTDRLSNLFYCHDAVMAEYARHLEAHVGETAAEGQTEGEQTKSAQDESSDDGPDKNSILKFLDARIREIEAAQLKHSPGEDGEAIGRVLSRLREIAASIGVEERIESEALERDLAILDELLTSELKRTVTQEQLEAWEVEAKQELKVYKKRLPKETYAKIVENFRRGKIHRLFNIGELSLFHI